MALKTVAGGMAGAGAMGGGANGAGGGPEVRRALVALGEEAEGVDLLHEVGNAGPATEAEADHQHPRHHERVDDVRPRPPPHQPRRRLHRVLHRTAAQESN